MSSVPTNSVPTNSAPTSSPTTSSAPTSGDRWNDAYLEGSLPWDTGTPDADLVEAVRSGALPPGRILEVGCGTGTNAVWLAGEGFSVAAVDCAPQAIVLARERAEKAGVKVDFAVNDILSEAPPGGPFDAAFDRGCFHVFDDASEREHFAENLSRVLKVGGRWLSLIGSTEGEPREMGPPRRSARDIVGAVEPFLEVVELATTGMAPGFSGTVAAWKGLFRKREMPAQPSSDRHGRRLPAVDADDGT